MEDDWQWFFMENNGEKSIKYDFIFLNLIYFDFFRKMISELFFNLVMFFSSIFVSSLFWPASIEEMFPELISCQREFVEMVSSNSVHTQSRDQLVALLTAAGFVSRHRATRSAALSSTEDETVALSCDAFCTLWNTVTSRNQNEFAVYVGQTLMEWWNFLGEGVSGMCEFFAVISPFSPLISFPSHPIQSYSSIYHI